MTEICADCRMIMHSVFLLAIITLFIMSIYALYTFLRNQHSQNKSILFWIGIIYIFLTSIMSLSFATSIIYQILSCWRINNSIFTVNITLYALQIYILGLLLLSRVYIAFKGSVYRLSKCTVYSLAIFFISCLLLVIVLLSPIWDNNDALFFTLIGLLFFATIIFCLWISSLFIYKLYKVTKGVDDKNDNKLLPLITKNTILAMFSIGATLFAIMIWVISFWKFTYGWQVVYALAFYFDIYSNFICVMMMYSVFDKYYQKCCKSVDIKCTQCCKAIIRITNIENDLGHVMSQDSQAKDATSNGGIVEISGPEALSVASSTNTDIDIKYEQEENH